MLGAFSLGLFTRLDQLRTAYDGHAAETSGVHGAVAAATASRIIQRDAAGRAQVAEPSVAADIATKNYVDTSVAATPQGTVTSVGSGTGLTGGPVTGTGTLSLANTAVAPGTYSFATVTVDAQGRITSASNGSPVTSVGVTAPITKSGAGTTPTIGISAATTGAAGSMSAADKVKLNGIASGAQVNTINSFNGRTGNVVPQTGDYSIQGITGVTVSSASPSGGTDGSIWFQW